MQTDPQRPIYTKESYTSDVLLEMLRARTPVSLAHLRCEFRYVENIAKSSQSHYDFCRSYCTQPSSDGNPTMGVNKRAYTTS